MNLFALARMRLLPLLALWHETHPDGHELNQRMIGNLSSDALAALIAPPRRAPGT